MKEKDIFETQKSRILFEGEKKKKEWGRYLRKTKSKIFSEKSVKKRGK